MPHSEKSCAVAFPRVLKNATGDDCATEGATENQETASKPASLQELREQLRAQLASNKSENGAGEITGQLRDELREISDWLHRIGETDPAIIDCTLEACRTDIDALDYFLGRARE